MFVLGTVRTPARWPLHASDSHSLCHRPRKNRLLRFAINACRARDANNNTVWGLDFDFGPDVVVSTPQALHGHGQLGRRVSIEDERIEQAE
jgi:hypothetical protein